MNGKQVSIAFVYKIRSLTFEVVCFRYVIVYRCIEGSSFESHLEVDSKNKFWYGHPLANENVYSLE